MSNCCTHYPPPDCLFSVWSNKLSSLTWKSFTNKYNAGNFIFSNLPNKISVKPLFVEGRAEGWVYCMPFCTAQHNVNQYLHYFDTFLTSDEVEEDMVLLTLSTYVLSNSQRAVSQHSLFVALTCTQHFGCFALCPPFFLSVWHILSGRQTKIKKFNSTKITLKLKTFKWHYFKLFSPSNIFLKRNDTNYLVSCFNSFCSLVIRFYLRFTFNKSYCNISSLSPYPPSIWRSWGFLTHALPSFPPSSHT